MKWLKVGAVIFGALIVTALGIDAADTLSGSRSTLLGELIASNNLQTCPKGMAEAPMAQTFTCVDIYEASADASCPNLSPQNEIDTKNNVDTASCKSASVAHVQPWRFITREQAATECIRAGKRLPKSDEWYLFAAGTVDDAAVCNTNSQQSSQTGDHQKCLSAVGVQDAIGNVWEWVSDDVESGKLQDRTLPESGYVSQVDSNGIATVTDSKATELFYKDYFWSKADGAFGILRGGFYGSGSDAGIYSVHADTVPTTAGTAIGFRCVK